MSTTRPIVHHGDCLAVLRTLPDESVDAVVTDPPYGLSNTDPKHVAETLTKWVTGDHEYTPPAKGGFMNKTWDSFVPPPAVWDECMRVLKPGGHLLVFAGTRTQDLMGLSIRLAGFDIRDGIGWIYGSGFPKSMDVSKAIDKARTEDLEPAARVAHWLCGHMEDRGVTRKDINVHFGHSTAGSGAAQQWTTTQTDRAIKPRVPKWEQWLELKTWLDLPDDMDAEVWRLNGRKGTPSENWDKREVLAEKRVEVKGGTWADMAGSGRFKEGEHIIQTTAPATPEAERWAGWGTALKPAIEPVIVARKPIRGTVAANVLAHGTGGINVDACRVEGIADRPGTTPPSTGERNSMSGNLPRQDYTPNTEGRFPPNVLLDPEAAAAMDEQSGWQRDGIAVQRNGGGQAIFGGIGEGENKVGARKDQTYGSGGGASRFFPVFKYQAKAPAKERPQHTAEDGTAVKHPTVKPLELMRWLVRLVTPPGGVVLDPFAGSGTTGEAAMLEGFDSILIEGEAEYLPLIDVRIERSADETTAPEPEPTPPTLFDRITACTSRAELADLYDEVTATDPAAWLDEHTAAGTAHLATIERITP